MIESVDRRRLEVGESEPASRPYDAIVVGAGMSGLSSGMILAKEGMRVLVLEQHDRIGGYLHRFFRKGGVQFDVGFHYVGGVEPGQVLGRYLAYCGVADRLELIPFDPTGFDELRFPDRRVLVPAGYEQYRERLLEAFPNERAGIDAYCRILPQVVDGFAFYRLRATQDTAHSDRWMSTPLGQLLDGLIGDAALKAVLCGHSPLYGVEPRRTPVALHALVTDTYMQNPYTFRGGGDRLTQCMGQRLEEAGGEIRTGRLVAAILLGADHRVRGVRTEQGEEFLAPLVVSSAHPKVTLSLLPLEVLGPASRRRLSRMEDGVGTVSVYVTTQVDLTHYRGRNIYNYKTTDIDGLYAGHPGEPGRPFAFVTVPSAREGVTEDGRHLVTGFGLMRYAEVARWAETRVGARGAEYEEIKARAAEEILALIVDAVPELKGHIVSVEAATPLTNRDYSMSAGGAAYGLHHSVEQTGRMGLKPRTRIPGLHLTGQSVLFPGVCGVTISAFHTAAGILGADYLMDKVRQAA